MYVYRHGNQNYFKTVSDTIHNFHINLHCSYFLTDQHSHILNKKFSLVLNKYKTNYQF